MTTQQQLDLARDQLSRVLNFFPRLETKHSVVLALDTGMLAFLAAHVASVSAMQTTTGVAVGLTLFCLGKSLWHLYHSGRPLLDGGHRSLIYFREIAVLEENEYIDAFTTVGEKDLLRDLLSQVWRNSEILTEKFAQLDRALRFTLLAIVPWLFAITLLTATNTL